MKGVADATASRGCHDHPYPDPELRRLVDELGGNVWRIQDCGRGSSTATPQETTLSSTEAAPEPDNTTTSTVDTSTSAASAAPLPMECTPDDVGSGVDDELVVLACSDSWALTQLYEDCNGAKPCEAQHVWSVWSGRDDDDTYLGYNTYPFSYCRARVAADGAPAWLLETVPWPECEGDEQPVDYRPEPGTGPLSRGDYGPRTALLQLNLADGEYPVGGVDGYFGWNTERAVRMVQDTDGLAITGVADEVTLERRGQIAPCVAAVNGDTIGIQVLSTTTCDEATNIWSRFVGGQTATPGWACQAASDAGNYAPAITGRCTGPDFASLVILAGWSE